MSSQKDRPKSDHGLRIYFSSMTNTVKGDTGRKYYENTDIDYSEYHQRKRNKDK